MGKRKRANPTPPAGPRVEPGHSFKKGGKKPANKKYACGGKLKK